MKPEELRIGNYIKYHGVTYLIHDISIREGKYVSNLFSNAFRSVATHLNIPISDLKPILLTEDWLTKKFRLKNRSENFLGIRIRPAHWLEISLKAKRIIVFHQGGFVELNFKKNVHEFQNLYQALTLKELEIQTIEA